jgi:hypothetical protein
MHPDLRESVYDELEGMRLILSGAETPSRQALAYHWEEFIRRGGRLGRRPSPGEWP